MSRLRLAVMVALGVILSAIPFFGAAVLAGGFVQRALARKERRTLTQHFSDEPVTPIANAELGRRLRLQGRITSEPTVQAPLSGEPVVLAMVYGVNSSDGQDAAVPSAIRGRELELRDDTGLAKVMVRHAHIVSQHVVERRVDDSRSDQNFQRFLEDYYPDRGFPWIEFDMTEVTLRTGDVLDVQGTVVGEATVEVEGTGYREPQVERMIEVTCPEPEGERLLLTNVDQQVMERALRRVGRQSLSGAIWLVVGALGLGTSALIFFLQ